MSELIKISDDTFVLQDKSILVLFKEYCQFFPNFKAGWRKPRKKSYYEFSFAPTQALKIFTEINKQDVASQRTGK